MERSSPPPGGHPCRGLEILERVASKWGLYLISVLGDGPKRFNELKREVDGISQRMLTATLRGLERDGILTRTMYPEVPPRVEYELTELGSTLLDAAITLMAWTEQNIAEVDAARARFDARAAAGDREFAEVTGQ